MMTKRKQQRLWEYYTTKARLDLIATGIDPDTPGVVGPAGVVGPIGEKGPLSE